MYTRGPTLPPKPPVPMRRGAALFVVLLFVVAVGALAITSIVTTGNAALVAKSHARENDLRYAAEAALAIGKSRLNFDADALPDTGYVVLLSDAALMTADNLQIPGVKVTVFAGPSGSSSGQFGRFASVVAEARDNQGNGFIRRLELTQESFAKYAYWSNDESNSSGTIYFGGGDQLWGPVWSNDVISIAASGATFHDEVATAKTVSGASNGTFFKGYRANQTPIALPSTAKLSPKLLGFAQAGSMAFTAPTTTSEAAVRMRIEFVAIDLNGDGDSLDVDEGFMKVYQSNTSSWVRSDYPVGSPPSPGGMHTCGDYHAVAGAADPKFFPASVHATTWFRALMEASGMTSTAAKAESAATVQTIMNRNGSRCFLGGAPQLAPAARTAALYSAAAREKGGDDTTFTAVDAFGQWIAYTTSPNAAVAARRPNDAGYLFPLHRTLNTGAKGVIHVTGNVGVSGTLRGKVTLYATGTIVVLDDQRYANDPGTGICQDMLGLLAARNIVVADNAILTPQRVKWSGSSITKNLDDTKDLHLQSVVMALNTSFTVEDYATGPSNVNDCEGSNNGRGCLYLTGGLIQRARGAVGLLSGQGFVKRYSYDRCAIINPPPYFPTTGRFSDNRYYELNPVGFDARTLYKSITPDQ